MADFLRVGFLLLGILINPSACQTKCLMYLDEAREIFGSKIPPINDSRMTDNYYNISRALYPSVHLPALYVKVTIQFLKDYQNGTKMIDDQEKNLKYTWSKACSYVSVKHISLYTMSVFSLFTIYPQRRQTELVMTVPNFCHSSPYVTKDDTSETWRYVVATLEDIIINPKISDPRLNTACCVVKGHEGDIAEYPNLGYFYWSILVSSFFASLSLWIFLLQSISDNMKKKLKESNSRRVCGAALRMTCPSAIIMLIVFFSISLNDMIKSKANGEMFIYIYVYIGSCLLSFFIGVLGVTKCDRNSCKCVCICKCFRCKCFGKAYVAGSCFLFPCLFQTIHYFLWVICGIVSEPFWAIPMFLLECLFLVSILFALFLYEKYLSEKSTTEEDAFRLDAPGGNGCIVVGHLVMCWLSFTLVLITVALIAVNNGYAVASPTVGAIETAMIVIFIWLVKNSKLDFWSFKPAPTNDQELQLQFS